MNAIELMQKSIVVNDEYTDAKGNKILVVRESDVVRFVTDLMMEQYDLGVSDCKKAASETIEAAIEATKEKAAKVCEAYSDAAELEAIRNQSPFADGESSGALGCAAAIRSMK